MKKNLYALFLLFISSQLFAGNFTPGNIVVVRLGDGSTSLSSAATPTFLDEYTPAGTLVQSIALPTSASGSNHMLTNSGTATSEGALTLSTNGQLLVLAGYDAAVGLAAVASDTTTNRTIATVSANGTVNTSTGFVVGSAYKKNNIRGAATQDGSAFWCSGAGSGTSGGTWYTTAGSFTSSPVDISSTISSTRAINIFSGQLYASSGSSSYHGINAIGTGLPTAAGQTSANLPGMPGSDTASSAYGFLLVGGNVLYVCDDRSASTGGLLKYSLVGGTWVSNGNISSQYGLRGVTGYASCGGVTLFVSGGGGVYSLTDNSGFNQTITGALNQLVTPATNTAIRGIAFAPGTTGPTTLQANLTAVNVTCGGYTNGSISNAVVGGTAPYTYNWSNSSTAQNLSNVGAATYSVTVNDAGGCSATASATITQPSAIAVSGSATAVICNGGNNGGINLTVSGGSGSYTFNWSNGATVQNLTNVISGSYTVTVTDTHNCTGSSTSSVSQPTAITVVPTVTNLPCTGGAGTGAVNIAVSGGTGADTYAWSNSSTTQNITGLNAGTFTVTVTDAAHCTVSQSAIVSQSGSMTISFVVTDVLCFGQSTGGITVTATGGTPAYNYAWSTGNNNVPQTGLAAGNYIVTVTDQGGCTLINSIAVTQPAVINAQVNSTSVGCYGGNTGGVSISVTGGVQPYSYLWSNTSTAQNLTALTAATYSVIVTDSNSCTATASIAVSQPTDSVSITATVINATAFGNSDGAINLTVTGGTPGYTYTWNTGSGADNTGLAAGQYCVTVSDTHGCPASDCYTVTQPTGITQTEIASDFKIYWSNDLLVLNADLTSNQNCIVQIRDITGRMVYNATTGATSLLQMQISTNSFSPGCYIVTLAAGEGAVSKKVVITR